MIFTTDQSCQFTSLGFTTLRKACRAQLKCQESLFRVFSRPFVSWADSGLFFLVRVNIKPSSIGSSLMPHQWRRGNLEMPILQTALPDICHIPEILRFLVVTLVSRHVEKCYINR
ncbi:hypothetical protein COMA2_40109 [Candidatus Nitrospira nitrificans]|uniref:Uncharacterized protein n=1 Tax=Candidatus Nitrospira nitrificans TaxID=1742973 RepID=A0A0S4LLW4_9BACT|nr:hypothetical protein COMA2_40109 [Candidatus Nitrospira nitrificans]